MRGDCILEGNRDRGRTDLQRVRPPPGSDISVCERDREILCIDRREPANRLAGERPVAGQIINVGSGTATSVNDVARLLSEIAGVPVRTKRVDPRPGDVRDSRADITKAAQKLGFSPTTSLREGLERTLAWYRAQTH